MTARVTVDGKFLRLAGRPFRARGVTYGSFLPRLDGEPFPERARMKEDLRAIADAGLNTVRTYEVPPIDVLETAEELGLRLLVGLHYHDWRMEAAPSRVSRRRILSAGIAEVDRAVDRCAPFPNVLAIAVGNEVPADIVRVHGIAAVEDTLGALVDRVHTRAPEMLATYVNFPTTEYLDVEGQDLVCFNVFLEDPAALRRYLRHLQVVSGPRPLLVTELGLASEQHGETAQAESLAAQLAVVDETGCAGATVFAWTDEWGVDGKPVDGWGFGITTADRAPKPATTVVRDWARRDLRNTRPEWPRVSVIVCAYNEEGTLAECLTSLRRCRYPDLEVIVCDDGSTDGTVDIARRFPFTLLQLDHGGLSRARNAGLAAATGDVVAYLDADAACHPDWPFYLVLSLEDERVVATGGPNHACADVGFVERAVALSPGNPAEVLLTDDRAEHVPGCNMAYRRDALAAIGGFDPAYTAAGDDVDVCWKLLDRGHEIAYAPAAQVSHHRRRAVRGYLRQQRGYGRAEGMLASAHPHRFNRLGQARWRGFIYGGSAILPSLLRPVVYHGYQGHAPFQPVAHRRAEHANMWAGAFTPLVIPIALAGAALGLVFSPWWFALTAFMLLLLATYGCSVSAAVRLPRDEPHPLRMRALVGLLHVLQPVARTWGRLRSPGAKSSRPDPAPTWSGDRVAWIAALEEDLLRAGCHVRAGAPSDGHDLEVTRGPFVAGLVTTAVAWHWTPQSRIRFRLRKWTLVPLGIAALLALRSDVLAFAFAVASLGAVLVNLATLATRLRAALAHTTSESRS